MSKTLSSTSSRFATLIATSALSLAAAHAGAATVAYVSNADSQDIYVLRLNGDGSVNLIDKVDTGSTVMPLALSPDHKFLYAALRGQPYSVVSYAIDPASGKLKALSKVPLADNMANIATDRSGRYLLAASYSGNRISVNAIGTDGTVRALRALKEVQPGPPPRLLPPPNGGWARASGQSSARARGAVLPFLAEMTLDVLPRRAWPGLEVASPHHRTLQQLRDEEGLEQPHRRPHPDEHLAQMREDGQRHHGVGCEMQGMDFVEIQNLMEESGERRNQARHGEGQEVHGSLRISRPRP